MKEQNGSIFKSHEVSTITKILNELGIKGVIKYSQSLMINHLIRRGYLSENRKDLITELKKHTDLDYQEIMGMVNEYNTLEKELPSYSVHLNDKMDKVNGLYDSTIPFKWIDKKLVGIIQEGNRFSIMDASSNHMIRLATIDENYHIIWSSHWIVGHSIFKYGMEKLKEIKKMEGVLT